MFGLPIGPSIAGGVAIAALCAGAYGSWQIKSHYAEIDKTKAVAAATTAAQKEIDKERELRQKYQQLVDVKMEELLKSISNIKVEHTTITRNITKEIQVNREFYVQKLPDGGFEQWKRARALVSPVSAAASSPHR